MTVAVHLDMKVRISKLRGSVGHGLPMTWDAPEQGWQLPGASRFQIVRAERAGPTRPLRLLAPPIRAVLACRRWEICGVGTAHSRAADCGERTR